MCSRNFKTYVVIIVSVRKFDEDWQSFTEFTHFEKDGYPLRQESLLMET